jgi:hypothetical protein
VACAFAAWCAAEPDARAAHRSFPLYSAPSSSPVFDNKSKSKSLIKQIQDLDFVHGLQKFASDFMPRVGIVVDTDGTISPIYLGDASALEANDLECVALLDADSNLYVATTSLGVTHVFKLDHTLPGCFSTGFISAKHVAKGQLPVPADESTTYEAVNRTNIEATAVFKDASGAYKMFWAGRGGVKTGSSWTRTATFDPATGSIDVATMNDGKMANVTGKSQWRNASSMVIEIEGNVTTYYFSSCYDGEEAGSKVDMAGTQQSPANKAVFKSVIAKTTFTPGLPHYTSILARYEGIKIEALMKVEDAKGKVTGLLIGTDDEGLGSLLGFVDLKKMHETTFVDIAKLNESKTFISKDKWGTSGMAPPSALASNLFAGSF